MMERRCGKRRITYLFRIMELNETYILVMNVSILIMNQENAKFTIIDLKYAKQQVA